jgi:iron complex outermembrane receptor protein
MKHTLLRDAIRRALFAGATLAVVLPLHAQDAAPAAAVELTTVTVTGSRIARSVEDATVQPVQVITREDMQRTGMQSVGDILQNSTVMGSPAISRASALSSGEAVGGTFVSLRNLGAQRTLVLLNGQRLGVTTGGLADVSQIPTAMVERIEILKDGASAIYGSDAIAGVVNIITRKRVEGGEANVYLGQYDTDDGAKQSYDATFGAVGDRSWVTASVTYAKEDPVWAKDRPYTATSHGPDHPMAGRSPVSEKGFLVHEGIFKTLRPGGDPRNIADYVTATVADYANPNQQMTLLTGMERTALFFNAGHDLNADWSFTVDGLYNHRDTMQQIAGYPWSVPSSMTSSRLSADSWFNPTGADARYLRRTWEVPRQTLSQATTQRIGANVHGRFDFLDLPWTVDAGFYRSVFRTVKDSTGNLLIPAVERATGASWFNPDTNRVECGTAAAPIAWGSNYGAGQCIPWNPLAPYGSGLSNTLADPALRDYLMPIGHDVGETETNAMYAGAAGVLTELPAGDLGFAMGYEHRREKGGFSPDALRQTGLSTNLGSGNSSGKYDLDELYAEVNVPLLRDKPFAHALAVNIATRYSDYSSFGSTTRSKASLEWRPIEDVLARGTWGQGFRAPTIADLYGPRNQTFAFYTDPCDVRFGAASGTAACLADVPGGYQQIGQGGIPVPGPNSQSGVPFNSGANPDLQPERSTSTTLGVVYSPRQLEGFSASLDWWKVRVDDAISSDSPTSILNDCYIRNVASRCARFTRDPATGQVTSLDFSIANIAYFETAGYDIFARYAFPEQRWGRIGVTWDSTYVDYYEAKANSTAAIATQYNGSAGYFRLRSNVSTDWSLGNHGIGWNLRYFSSMTEPCQYACSDPQFAAPYTNGRISPRNKVGSNTFNDVQYRWSTSWSSTVSVGVNNVFDKVGPMMYSQPASSFAYYGGFDIGRFLYLQYQQKF